MTKQFNMSYFKSQMRQAQHKAERQIKSEINKVTRQFENDVKHELRKYNSTVRHNQQVITRELKKLQSHTTAKNNYIMSLSTMYQYYTIIRNTYQDCAITPEQEYLLELVEREQANGLITGNVVEYEDFSSESTEDGEISNKLLAVSEDLSNRWKGAVFALNPHNPDAARHFCTSAREIFTKFIESKAPDTDVFIYNPNAEKTKQGNATRKEKIKYMLRNIDLGDCVVDFADADIQNILELFFVFNGATHGEAGKYEFTKLLQVKKRVEQGINFLCEISA